MTIRRARPNAAIEIRRRRIGLDAFDAACILHDMICHEHRCIFLHIQRTAGTNIERWIVGDDWWAIRPETKHLLASQAKRLYADFWDDYFKFSFVRNPVERMISCLIFANHFGLEYSHESGFCFDGYHRKYGSDIVLEIDTRFSEREALLSDRHQSQSVYGNILDEPLDFIGRVENIEEDLHHVQRAIGKKEAFRNARLRRENHEQIRETLSTADRNHIEHMFRRDLERFSLSM